jgi:hypothetical protein
MDSESNRRTDDWLAVSSKGHRGRLDPGCVASESKVCLDQIEHLLMLLLYFLVSLLFSDESV